MRSDDQKSDLAQFSSLDLHLELERSGKIARLIAAAASPHDTNKSVRRRGLNLGEDLAITHVVLGVAEVAARLHFCSSMGKILCLCD